MINLSKLALAFVATALLVGMRTAAATTVQANFNDLSAGDLKTAYGLQSASHPAST